MTVRAREAIAEADMVIGYATYIALLGDLTDGKEVIQKGMTQEVERCVEAIRHAEAGKTVALISSGDAGIYGMAGLLYQMLFQFRWQPETGIGVEVVPGCPALSTCASLVGAPVGHDFCAISLSDLMTPWPVIARRLEAAARADFVLALYNPKSRRRTGQIVAARRILLRHRDPNTPVAIVDSAYRHDQSIQITTLEEMAHCEIGMLSTVLIGNRKTFLREGLMVTPRGYAGKYPNLTATIRNGERAGRSLNLGLEGWHGVVRAWFEGNPEIANPDAAATFFDAPLGEILTAIAGATATEPAGGFTAHALDPSRLEEILSNIAEIPTFGRYPENATLENGAPGGGPPITSNMASAGSAAFQGGKQSRILRQALRVGMRSNGCAMEGEIFSLALQQDDRILASGEALHAQVPVAAVASVWLVSRPMDNNMDNDNEIYLLDKNEDLLLRVRYGQQGNGVALEAFRLR